MSPLEQFSILTILEYFSNYYDLSITLPYILIIIGGYSLSLIPILTAPLCYIHSIIRNEFLKTLGSHNRLYLPLVTFTFYLILYLNLLGLLPYSFALTGQLSITLFLSSTIMITVTYLSWSKYGYDMIDLFIPNNVPFLLVPYITFIEIFSYSTRVLSLAIRLSTNIIAGHVLIWIICSFGFKAPLILQFILVIPVLCLFLLLELVVASIQAYVFIVLLATYIKDSMAAH